MPAAQLGASGGEVLLLNIISQVTKPMATVCDVPVLLDRYVGVRLFVLLRREVQLQLIMRRVAASGTRHMCTPCVSDAVMLQLAARPLTHGKWLSRAAVQSVSGTA